MPQRYIYILFFNEKFLQLPLYTWLTPHIHHHFPESNAEASVILFHTFPMPTTEPFGSILWWHASVYLLPKRFRGHLPIFDLPGHPLGLLGSPIRRARGFLGKTVVTPYLSCVGGWWKNVNGEVGRDQIMTSLLCHFRKPMFILLATESH